jgi:hypothetical protein
MYFMVVVVAAVDAVDKVSLAKSEPFGAAGIDVQIRKSHGEDLGIS